MPRPSRSRAEVEEHFGSAVVIVGAVLAYIFLSERIGFLFIAPLCLLAVFLALRVRWQTAAAVRHRRHAGRASGLLQAAARAAALGPADAVLLTMASR